MLPMVRSRGLKTVIALGRAKCQEEMFYGRSTEVVRVACKSRPLFQSVSLLSLDKEFEDVNFIPETPYS